METAVKLNNQVHQFITSSQHTLANLQEYFTNNEQKRSVKINCKYEMNFVPLNFYPSIHTMDSM